MLLAILVAATGLAQAPNQKTWALDFISEHSRALGVPLAECEKPVYHVAFTAKLDAKGDGTGTLVFDSTAPAYDELGAPAPSTAIPPVKFDCTLKLEKTLQVKVFAGRRLGAPPVEVPPAVVVWKLFAITGPKITSKLFLAMPTGSESFSGRLLVHDDKGKVKYVVELRMPPQAEPCHPGCFPAGTSVQLRDRTTTVEKIAAGDKVATIGPDGATAEGVVESVFVTTNKLIEVKTAAGTLVTTETQPLALKAGGLRAAGELKAGDEIWRWDGKECRATAVESVTATGRREKVFNLILKDEGLFVAGGFLARSKPPATPIPPP